MNPHYGGRLFTNFYKKRFNIQDKNKQISEPVKNKDLLNNKYDKKKASYWINRVKPKSTMKQQFWLCGLLKNFGIF